jgi:hypothetical protein
MIKKILAGVLVVALIGASGAGALNYLKKSRETYVTVAQVDALASDYYAEDTILEGTVTTNVSQNIRVDSDMIVEEVYVNEGDSVSVGDRLVSFDMTLVEMELNIAKLKKQQQENELDKAVTRLNSLKNGGPIEDSSDSSDTTISGSDDLASNFVYGEGTLLAAVGHPLLLAALEDFGEEFESGSNDSTEDDFSSGDFSSGESGDTDVNTGNNGSDHENIGSGDSDTSSDPLPGEDDDFTSGDDFAGEFEMDPADEPSEDFQESDIVFYEVLDAQTLPFTGTGTEEDPYIFLCSSENGSVTAMGSFLNLMAGYNAEGTELLHEGGYWYQLEFHQDDELLDTEDRTASCVGYYLVDGGLLSEPVAEDAFIEYTLADAMTYDDMNLGDDWGSGGSYGDDSSGSSMTREEAIKVQENRISSLNVDIKESELNITKLEKKVSKQTVYSKIDGVVSHVGDTLSSGSQTLLTIKSKEGYYVQGTVSELMLDEMTEGTYLDCTSYQSGDFEAQVVEVSDYPVSSSSTGFYSSDSNPNVSYYQFNASIEDQSIELSDGDWLQITLKSDASQSGKLVLSRAFVRSENGNSYVYKEENGVLKKQYITIGESVDYGYSVVIKSGITRDDYIAFPYGKTVVDGAKTQEGTVSDIYGYDW